MSQYIIQGIFAFAGILSVLASLLDWDWFFTAQNSQFIVRNVGRRQARWFYGLLGLLLIGMSLFFFLNTPAEAAV
ncbi:MAG: immunity 17 family protein [Bacteroides sp.]